MILLELGAVLILLSAVTIHKYVSSNEWRAPLLDLTNELDGRVPREEQQRLKLRGVAILLFSFGLYGLGGSLLVKSSILQNYVNIVQIALLFVLVWLLKGAIGLIRALYSQKAKLMNYLFSPYLFAWKRDFLSKYTDQEIAAAILKVCEMESESISEDLSLPDFLIELHRRTRPENEHPTYPELVKNNMSLAEDLSYK